eukprot:TRINITY_DN4167_c0_g1_i3.p1 TRINITY_DN4167_c0_g1~~TRINITY_DN4167_c0_g1_i3.p1  ORF type:complete len:272 (-),score=96.17 TRINITY_DN4167_c0_g1_i3:108-923(-)
MCIRDRYKTRTLKATLQKELKGKEGMRITDPKRIRKVYLEIDDLRDEVETNKEERDKFQKQVRVAKATTAQLTERKVKLEKSSDLKESKTKVWDAKYSVSLADYHSRCEYETLASLRAKLVEAKAVAKQRRTIAVAKEKYAQNMQHAAERANKAMVQEEGSDGSEDREEEAAAAGDSADIATHDAQRATKSEVAATTKKDQLQLEVARVSTMTENIFDKALESKKFLARLQKQESAKKVADEQAKKDAEEVAEDTGSVEAPKVAPKVVPKV